MSSFEKPILVIGYGSTLRGDDAVGRRVVEIIANRILPNVTAVSVTQLVPELAAQIATAQAVIFVDASSDSDLSHVDVREIVNVPGILFAPHIFSPRELLSLASACYERTPPAWLIAVPSMRFEITDGISSAARRNICSAVDAVEQLINELSENAVPYA
ncbi:MAG TPA: hydrogenase maturation protease [Lacipirellulaceae bacterium]